MHLFHNPRLAALKPALLLALLLAAFCSPPARAAEPRVSLARHAAQTPALRGARLLGRLAADTPLHFALTLPLRHQAALDTLLRRQYTPGDALYGHFVTSDEFVEQFGPTEEDYQAVAAWAQSQGLVVTGTHAGRTVLDVAGTARQVETAFAIRMNHYQAPDGRVVFANSGAPRVARSVAARLAGVAGLSDISRMRPHFHRLTPRIMGMRPSIPVGGGTGVGSGPAGGLTPNDIKYAYGLSAITPLFGSAAGTTTGTATLLDGKGQTIGVFELDGYNYTDIDKYISTFSLPAIPGKTGTTTQNPTTVQAVLVDNFNGSPLTLGGQEEVTLDIDMALALAPNAATIYSYEGNQGTTAATANSTVVIDIFQKMADDKAPNGSGKPLLQVISTSWGLAEQDEDPAIRNAENIIFQKMAAQGQSLFSATGDFGAFDGYPKRLGPEVDSPASQPFVTAVGGTTLNYSKPGTNATTGVTSVGSYVSESAWKVGTINNPTGPEGGGGGSSVVWPKPSYQLGLGASGSSRDIPDVSLNAGTGYDIYVNGSVGTFVGTSASAPLWAGFAALVNQQRGLNGLATTLGFANPILYGLGKSASYTTLFHDVTQGDNLYYLADVGFDDATGFGSFIGAPLIAALSANADQGTGTAILNGFVTDSSGNPVSGATVTATSIATSTVKATATTDPAGAYTLTVPGGLALTITVDTSTVTAAGGTHYASPSPVSLTLTAGTTTAQNFVLVPANTFAAGLQMISAPYDFSGLGDFATLFGLATPLATPNPRLIQWQPAFGVYVFYPTAPADTLRLGQGYWIKFPSANFLHRLGVPASLTQSFRIPLVAGWNQIGDPFLGSVPLSTVTADTAAGSGAVALTAAASPVQSNLFRYDPGTGAYVAVDPVSGTLDPYNGYWIYAKQAAVLIVPPQAGPPPPPGGAPAPPPAPGG
jgi:subtilase family serine protease